MNIGLIPYRNAKRYPHKEALVDANVGKRITWKEFNRRINHLAHAFLAYGLKKGDRVAIYSKNCIEYLEIFFAGAKTGIIIQPLNWRFTPDEIAYTINDGSPRVIIVHDQYNDTFTAIRSQLSSVEFAIGLGHRKLDINYEEFLNQGHPDEPETITQVQDDDVYFICYTGGTTGIAKGVMLTHKNALTTIFNMTVAERIRHEDVYLILGQMFHVAVLLPHGYLFHGAKVVVLNFEPRRTLEVIEQERVTSFLAISTMLNYLLDVPDFNRFDLSSLRLISYGGGPVGVATLMRAIERFPGVGFLQYMGQTELAIMCAWLSPEDHVRALEQKNYRLLESCGREAILCDVRVVDEQGNDVPKDGKTVGEMIARGDNVMKGYWNRPELTAETVRQGWCYMGDMAAWDGEGYMYVVDRKKDMIVSGGENIYSTVVEEAIYKHPAVKECAVIGVPHPVYGETVKAIVVLREGCTATAEEIIEVCRQHLASYMKPTSVDFVDELPKAPTGKVLKRVLREKYWAGHKRRVGGV